MEEITAKAAAEVIYILDNTDISLVSKVPYKVLEFLKSKSQQYNEDIFLKDNIKLNEQSISQESKEILTIFYREYWCDEKGKKELDEILKQNQKIIEEKYSSDNIFKNTKNVDNINISENISNINNDIINDATNNIIENTQLKDKSLSFVKQQKWYHKFFNKIKELLKII